MIIGHCPRRLSGHRGHTFGVGQERPKARASRQQRGCESFPERQLCRQRREENCSCERASGPNLESPPKKWRCASHLGPCRMPGGLGETTTQLGNWEWTFSVSLLGLHCPSWEADQKGNIPASSPTWPSSPGGYAWPQPLTWSSCMDPLEGIFSLQPQGR